MKSLEKIIKSVKNFGKAALFYGALAITPFLGSCDETTTYEEQVPITQNPPANVIDGLSYSPFRDGQSPMQLTFPSEEEVEEDLSLISNLTAKIRTYGNDFILYEIPRLCEARNIDCYVGAWLDSYLSTNEDSINNLASISAQNYSHVKGFIVGNESLLAGYLTESELRDYMDRVRAETDIPVTTAENWDTWLAHPGLAQSADFILVHIHPYWAGIKAEDAAEYVVQKYNQVKSAFPGKEVMIGETGWPTGGSTRGLAVPSEANQSAFLQEFMALAETNNIKYFIFEGFEEYWKRQFGDVEDKWGLWNSSRIQKQSLDDLGIVSYETVDIEESSGCSPVSKGDKVLGCFILSAISLSMLRRYKNEKA